MKGVSGAASTTPGAGDHHAESDGGAREVDESEGWKGCKVRPRSQVKMEHDEDPGGARRKARMSQAPEAAGQVRKEARAAPSEAVRFWTQYPYLSRRFVCELPHDELQVAV